MERVDKDSPAADNPNHPLLFDPLHAVCKDGPIVGRKVLIPNKTDIGECLSFDNHPYRYVGLGILRHVNQEDT